MSSHPSSERTTPFSPPPSRSHFLPSFPSEQGTKGLLSPSPSHPPSPAFLAWLVLEPPSTRPRLHQHSHFHTLVLSPGLINRHLTLSHSFPLSSYCPSTLLSPLTVFSSPLTSLIRLPFLSPFSSLFPLPSTGEKGDNRKQTHRVTFSPSLSYSLPDPASHGNGAQFPPPSRPRSRSTADKNTCHILVSLRLTQSGRHRITGMRACVRRRKHTRTHLRLPLVPPVSPPPPPASI